MGFRVSRGFSLVELLVVLAILGVVMGVSVGSVIHSDQQHALSRAQQAVFDYCIQARSVAMERRESVRVLYDPGPRAGTLRIVNERDRSDELRRSCVLPVGVFIDLEQASSVFYTDEDGQHYYELGARGAVMDGSDPTSGKARQTEAAISLYDSRGRSKVVSISALVGVVSM